MANIPKILAKALGKRKDLGVHVMTLTKVTPGVRTSLIDGTNPVATDYACKGFEDTKRSGYQQFWQNAQTSNTARAQFLTISILGATLPAGVEPMAGDRITSNGVVYTIDPNGVARDPVGALYTCTVRGAGG